MILKKSALVLGLVTLTGFNLYAQKGKVRTVVIKTSIACDHCQQCESCAPKMSTALYKVKGVKRVDINDKTNEVKIAYNTTKTDETALKKVLTSIGFNADDQKADPAAYAQLDSCCK